MPKKCTQGFTAFFSFFIFFWLPWFKYLQILCVSSLSGTLFVEQPTMCLVSISLKFIYILQMNVCWHPRWTGKTTTGLDRVTEASVSLSEPSCNPDVMPGDRRDAKWLRGGYFTVYKGGDPSSPSSFPTRLKFLRVPRDTRMFDVYSVSWCLRSVSFGVASQRPRFVDTIGSVRHISRHLHVSEHLVRKDHPKRTSWSKLIVLTVLTSARSWRRRHYDHQTSQEDSSRFLLFKYLSLQFLGAVLLLEEQYSSCLTLSDWCSGTDNSADGHNQIVCF